MELDELQKRWAVQDSKLEELLRWRLRTEEMGRARPALQRLRAGLGFEVLLNGLLVAFLGAFLGGHFSALRFAIPAAVLDVGAIALLASSVRQWVLASSVQADGPVMVSQRRLEDLRVLRIRTTKWTLLASPLLWTPFLIVGLEGFFAVDAYAVLGGPYLLANLLFGMAFIPLMLWAARRWAPRLEKGGWLRRWAEALAGTSLTSALKQLATLAEFEREADASA